MRPPYFKTASCIDDSPAPKPLSFSIERVVRFDEVDLMKVLWHGHYASYFEDARVALGEHFDIGYHTLRRHRLFAPIKQMYVDYRSPLTFHESCQITATLHWHEGARMNLSYQINNGQGRIVATGFSVQMFIDEQKNIIIEQPHFLHEFCQKWKNGEFN